MNPLTVERFGDPTPEMTPRFACGTRIGYRIHAARGERACPACAEHAGTTAAERRELLERLAGTRRRRVVL
jgi:hypothetical protein